jgi:hypothetical protein
VFIDNGESYPLNTLKYTLSFNGFVNVRFKLLIELLFALFGEIYTNGFTDDNVNEFEVVDGLVVVLINGF